MGAGGGHGGVRTGKTAQEWLNGMCALIAQRFDEEADNYSAIAIVAE